MFRLLLGMLVGAAATAAYMNRSSPMASGRLLGHVDELSSAAGNPVADPALDASDSTPSRNATTGV